MNELIEMMEVQLDRRGERVEEGAMVLDVAEEQGGGENGGEPRRAGPGEQQSGSRRGARRIREHGGRVVQRRAWRNCGQQMVTQCWRCPK